MPGYRPLLGMDCAGAAAWVDRQPDWPPLDVVGDFMPERALATIAAFPRAKAQTRASVKEIA